MRSPGRSGAAVGFTLIELLVVIAIVGILFAIVVPFALRGIENGRAATCMSNLRQLGMGLSAYLGDHDMTMPVLKGGRAKLTEDEPVIDKVFRPYLKDIRILACPSDPKYAKETGTSYFWNTALNGQHIGSLDFLRMTQELSRIPVAMDKEGFHPYLKNKVNMLYADGHATKDLKFTSAPE